MIFSKSYCPYCDKAKAVFDGLSADYGVIELDRVDEGAEIQGHLQEITGQRTVPSVWVNGKHIGGCDDTLSLHSQGKLKEMVK